MRKRSLDMVYELAKRDERVVFIGSDLSPGLLGEMKKAYPERYYMEGIAEANIIGMAAGMAMDGFVPYVNTIATFITRRCYEQVAIDLCLHDLPVRLIGNGGGYVYAPLGPTHQAIEDIAIMRALPNMTVTAVCDAEEMTRLMTASLDWPHPIYIRLARGGDPVVSRPENGFAIGKAIDMSDGAGAADVLLVATGVTTVAALDARKPLDTDAVVAAARGVRLVVTAEEHSVIGGLGSAVLEALADTGEPMPPVRRLGIGDEFARHYGSQQKLMDVWGINADGIVGAVTAGLARARQ
jgi:transketolase